MKFIIICILISCLFSMCCPDHFEADCSIPLIGFTSFPDSHSISYLKNYTDFDTIVFLDQNNDTVILNVVNRIDSLFPYEEFIKCEFDTTMNRIRTGFWNEHIVELRNQDLNINIFYRVWNSTTTNRTNYDLLWINTGSQNRFSNPLSSYQTYHPDSMLINTFVIINDSKVIGNIVYSNVIEPNINDTGLYIEGDPENGIRIPNPWVSYNREFGLLSIMDTIEGYELEYLYSK